MILSHLKLRSKYFSYFPLRNMLYSTKAKNNILITELADIIDLDFERTKDLVETNEKLLKINPRVINHSIQVLLNNNFSKEEIIDYPKLLSTNPYVIDNYISVYKEIGISKLTLSIIDKYLIVISLKISQWKKYEFLPQDYNITNKLTVRFSKHINQLPQNEDEDSIIKDIHFNIYKIIAWNYLEFNNIEEFNKKIKVYKRVRHKSINHFLETIDILTNEIGFTKEKIRNNFFLAQTHPDNIRKILKNKPTLGGVAIKEVLIKYPRIVSTPYESIVEIESYFDHFKISPSSISKCFNVYTLKPETIYNRLVELRIIPEFQILKDHPRILLLLYYQNKAKNRLKYFLDNDFKQYSINVLSQPAIYYERFQIKGAERARSYDVLYLLSNLLGIEEKYIFPKLQRHSFWSHLTLIDIKDNFIYLINKGFNKEQITESLQILTYHKDVIESHLANLTSNPELSPEFLNLSPEETKSYINNKKLQLCLYFIEKRFNFNGTGVWQDCGEIR